jgi:hypothetical protein
MKGEPMYYRLGSSGNGAKLHKMLDRMKAIERECGMYKPEVTDPELKAMKQARKDAAWKDRIIKEFRHTYLFRLMSSGYNTGDIERR